LRKSAVSLTLSWRMSRRRDNNVWRVVEGAAAACVVAAVVAASTACGSDGVLGCRVRSVDEAKYVALNDAVLETIPVYPGARLVNSFSKGQTAGDSCLPTENGPPYGSFTSDWVYSTDATPGRIIRYYRRALAGEWELRGYAAPAPGEPPRDSTFRRGDALFAVDVSEGLINIKIDHAAYAKEH